MPFLMTAPIVTEFLEWTGDNLDEIIAFTDPGMQFVDNGDGSLLLNGWQNMPLNSVISNQGWVVRPNEIHQYQEVPDGARRHYVVDVVEES